MKNAHTRFCVMLAAAFMAAGSLQAANQVIVQDAHCHKTAVTYPLPKGWKGNGDVKWNAGAEHQETMCVRTMQIVNEGEEATVHYISAYETPLRYKNPAAVQLAELLMPAVKRMPGKTATALSNATLYAVPQELADFRMGRDRLSRKLGKKIDGKVYAVAGTCTDGTVIGAIVYERSERKMLRTTRTVTFHDICIMSCDDASVVKSLSDLKSAAERADYNSAWLHDQIRITANSIEGMTKLDEKALPTITTKVEARLKQGLPTVIDCMYDSYNKQHGHADLVHR